MFLFSSEHDIFWERTDYWIRGKVDSLGLHVDNCTVHAISGDNIMDNSSYI